MDDWLADIARRLETALERRSADTEAPSGSGVLAMLRSTYGGAATRSDEDPLTDIAAAFDLGDLDRLLLAIAAAPDLDATFASAFALLQGDPKAVRASAGLALDLAGVRAADARARDRLAARAPLRANDLIEVVGDAPFALRPLRVPDRVTAALTGSTYFDPVTAAMVIAPAPPPVHFAESQELAHALRSGTPWAWITCPSGSAGLGMTMAAFQSVNASALVVDLRNRPPEVTATDAARIALREAGLLVSALVIVGGELVALDSGPAGLRLLERSPVPVILLSPEPWNPLWGRTIPYLLTAPVAEAQRRDKLWQDSVDRPVIGDSEQRAALVGLRLSPQQIAQASRYATFVHDVRSAEQPLTVQELREAARLVGTGGVRGATWVRPRQSFSDLVLPEGTLQDIHKIAQWSIHRDAVGAAGAIAGKDGRSHGITALFTGPPGTGKSLAAHVLASELGLDLFTIDLSTVVDKYIGETEKHLERILSAVEGLNAVLLFDEADSLFGARSGVQDAHDRYANQEIAFLLQRIERFSGIAILTTNFPGNVDAAFSRRLNFVISFASPDAETRLRLWRTHLGALGSTSAEDPVDEAALAEGLEVTGGDIKNIVLAATHAAVAASKAVGMQEIRAAAESEFRKQGRRLPALG